MENNTSNVYVDQNKLLKEETTKTNKQIFEEKKNSVTSSYFVSNIYLPVQGYQREVNTFYAYKPHSITIESGSYVNGIYAYAVTSSNANSDKQYYKILTSFCSHAKYNYNGYLGNISYNVGGLFITIPQNKLGENLQKNNTFVTIVYDGNSPILKDDGNGNLLYYSGDSSTMTGSIFYEAGVIFLPDSGSMSWSQWDNSDSVQFEFNSTVPIREKIWRCYTPAGELNYSYNKTAYQGTGSISGTRIINDPFIPYITTVGLYNEDNQLLAVAKLSKPIKKFQDLDISFDIRIDF
jgi:hypothetical protein